MKTRNLLAFAVCAALLAAASCQAKGASNAGAATKERNVAVFVPGVVSGNSVYEMLVSGVKRAAAETKGTGKPVTVTVIEAGASQAEWEPKLTALAADGTHDLIVTSNPAMPDIIAPISQNFPKQEFIVLDAFAKGNEKVTSFRYNQREQAYISGYIAALVSSSAMKYANAEKRIGLIAGQEYPAMTDIILPAYLEGARAVDPGFTVDFRVVGNWYDAAKGSELARAMRKAGVDVIMPIAGGANQGVLSAAQETGFYVAWFDDNGYARAPGYVVSSSVMAQERLAYEKTKAWIDGTLVSGEPQTVGIRDHYVDFVSDDPLYLSTVPADIRAKQAALMDRLHSGAITLEAR
jgi:simple sugar transport system substrate-binding protein